MTSNSRNRSAKIFLAVLLFAFSLTSCINRFFPADCAWHASAYAFVDSNSNHKRDDGEAPLEGVKIRIDDIYNHYRNVGEEAISNYSGLAGLNVWLPGCPKVIFEVYADSPPGYVPSTQPRIRSKGDKYHEEFSFGFSKVE